MEHLQQDGLNIFLSLEILIINYMKYNRNPFLSQSSLSEQFSFCKVHDHDSKSTAGLKSQLLALQKVQIIELLLEEVQQNKILKCNLKNLQEQIKLMNSFKDEESSIKINYNHCQYDASEQKYKQLVAYTEEYINHTNQVQKEMLNAVQRLRTQIHHKNQQIKELKLHQDTDLTVRKLQESLQHYIQINNQNTIRYDKLKKLYESKEEEVMMLKEALQEQRIQEDEDSIIKVLETQTNQLKERINQLEAILEKKSDKIRCLLEEIEKLSQEKWKYKQILMEMKTKSKISETTELEISQGSKGLQTDHP